MPARLSTEVTENTDAVRAIGLPVRWKQDQTAAILKPVGWYVLSALDGSFCKGAVLQRSRLGLRLLKTERTSTLDRRTQIIAWERIMQNGLGSLRANRALRPPIGSRMTTGRNAANGECQKSHGKLGLSQHITTACKLNGQPTFRGHDVRGLQNMKQ